MRIADPALTYTQNILEDDEFREVFCAALSNRMANKTLDSVTLRQVLKQVALEVGPYTKVLRSP
jgi:hypothetical protein